MNHKKFLLMRLLILKTVLAVVLLAIGWIIVSAVAKNPSLKSIVVPIIIAFGVLMFLLFGKVFCGFFCPIGLLNDVVWHMSEKLHLPKLSRNEKFMKKVNILQKIFLAFFVCGITSMIVIAVFFPKMLSSIHVPLFAIVGVVTFLIIVALLARRFFCNICPIGTFIGLFEKLNIVKLKKECSACTMCGACYEACPMRIKSVYTEQEKANVSSMQCIFCGECIKKCQEDDALSITICGKKIYKSSREDFMNNQFSDVTIKSEDKK